MENVFEPMASFNQDVFEPLENFEGFENFVTMKEALLKASIKAKREGMSGAFSKIEKNPESIYKTNMRIALLNLILKKSSGSVSNFGGIRDLINKIKKQATKTEGKKINSDLENQIINALSMYKAKFGKAFELDLPLFITNEESRFELKKQCLTDKKNRFFFDPKKTRNRIRDCQMSVDSQIDSKYSNFEDDYSNFGLLDTIKNKFRDLKSRKNLRISSSEHPFNFLIDKTDLINIKGAIKTSNFDGDEYFDDDYSNFGLKEWFKSTFGKKDISTQSTPTSISEEKKVFGMPRKTAIGVGLGLIAVGITAFFLIKKKK